MVRKTHRKRRKRDMSEQTNKQTKGSKKKLFFSSFIEGEGERKREEKIY